MAKRKTTDAHEPNAGYDFHVVWAIRKCLDLLNFEDAGLKAVAIESLDPIDSNEIDPDGDILLGVDLTEYYGDFHFSGAKNVVVSQLKYSTKHPNQKWTIAKMCTGKKGKAGSIMDRLGTSFKGFLATHGRNQVLKKIQFKLVTNRPIAKEADQLIQLAKRELGANFKVVNVAAFKKKLSASGKKDFTRLQQATKINGPSLIDFLGILDFTDTDTGSRSTQRQEAIKAISSLGAYDAISQFNNLHALLRSKTVPEAKGKNVIQKENILLEFGFSDLDMMFPVPSKFEEGIKVVPREQMKDICTSIKKANGGLPLCLHGVGGIGKSTVIRNLHPGLPAGSVTILFDCYGGGRYIESNDKRHKHEKAFLFLCNELALRTGAPFLLAAGRGNDYYLNEFTRRLEIVSELLKKSAPSAILSIIIDAADNAVTAAAQYKDDCFVHDIVNITFPSNTRLIVTTRNHRLDSLKLPQYTKKIEIEPFSKKETKAFLLTHLDHVSDTEVNSFRRLTRGIPRVMAYTMTGEGNTLAEKVKPLQPHGKDLDDIFVSLLVAVQRRSGENENFHKLLQFFTLLPRPIPLPYLEQVSTLSVQFIEDAVTDLGNGLILDHELLRFKDEDFEAFLRKSYPADAATYSDIATVFHDRADQDDYASTHLGYFLTAAGRHKDLQAITLERKFLNRPLDPIRQREVFIERARLAMRYASIQEDRLQFLQLQAVAAEASKTNKVLEEIILSNPELASAFGNAETNRKMYFQSGNFQWHGKVHLRSAAVLSREPATQAQAKEHLRSAEAWIRFRSRLEDERLREFDISETDLSFGGEAYLRLFGIQQCVRWFERWNPKTFVYESLSIFIRHMLNGSTKKEIDQLFVNSNPRVDVKLLINQVFFEQGWTPPYAESGIKSKIPYLQRASKKLSVQLMEALVSFAEQQFREGSASAKAINQVLDCVVTKFPSYLPNFYKGGYRTDDDLDHFELHFRIYILRHAIDGTSPKIDDLVPARLLVETGAMKYKERQYIDEEKSKYLSFFKHLLPVFQLRLEMFKKGARKKNIEKSLGTILTTLERDFDIGYRHQYTSRYLARYLSLKLLDGVFYLTQPESLIEQLKKDIKTPKGEKTDLYLKMANRLAGTERFQISVLRLLEDADKKIESDGLAGSTQVEFYTEAAIIASKVTWQTGKTYFDKLVKASSAIDREAYDQITLVADTMKAAGFLNNAHLAFNFAKYVEYCADRLTNYDDFPWAQAFDSIARMHMPSAFSILCRWDHRHVRKSGEHLTDILELSVSKNFINQTDAASLLPLNPYYWENYISLLKCLLQKYDESGDRPGKVKLAASVIHDMKLKCNGRHHWRIMLKALDLFKQGKFADENVVSDFKVYCSRIKEMMGVADQEETEEESITSLLRSAEERVPKLNFRGLNLATVKGIEGLLTSRGLGNENYRNYDVDAILSQVLVAIKPAQFTAHLDALVKVNPDLIGYWSFEEALTQRLRSWAISPEVKEWKKKNFGIVLSSRFLHYVRHDDYFQTSSVKKLADLFEVSDQDLADILFSILPDYISDLSAGVLYQLFSISAGGADTAVKAQFLEWIIPRWTEKIAPSFGDGPFSEQFVSINDPSIVLSQFLRYHLGHPDKRIRWQAAKALLRLSESGNTKVVDLLISSQNEKKCGAFQHPAHTFYWIASKLWLWIALHKISIKHPDKVKHLHTDALNVLGDNDLPHIQLRWFVQVFCLNLEKRFKGTYTAMELRQIRSVLKSQFRKIAEKSNANPTKRERKELRFDFDSMDTVDHWFQPLGRDFGLSSWEVAELAEKYIVDKWGFSGDVWEQDHVRNDDEEDYDLIRHYKFDIPVIEDLRTYYEYHSMQCVAGDLLATKPLLKIESYYREWDEWWPRFTLTWPDEWLPELMDPVPLEKKFWIEKGHSPEWEWNIQRKDFDELVGFVNPFRPGYLALQGAVTIHYGRDYESLSVKSALVTPEFGPSLLRTLQTSERYSYQISWYKEADGRYDDSEDDDNEDSALAKKFRVKAFLQVLQKPYDGVDDSDGTITNMDRNRVMPGGDFSKWAGLSYSDNKRNGIAQKSGLQVSLLENWSNTPRNPRHGSFSSHGQRLFIHQETLLNYLSAFNQAMIVNAEIYRRPERDESGDYSYYNLFYLIYPDGKVETIGKNFTVR